MAQVKIFGLKGVLEKHREALSKAIQSSLMEAFELPAEKRFQRFISLPSEDFLFPADRSENYTIIEFSVFEGRSTDAKKTLIRLLIDKVKAQVGIQPNDLEITIFETPMSNWGIRGLPADELTLNYQVKV